MRDQVTGAEFAPGEAVDLEFGDAEDLTTYGGTGRTFATPGHTPGSSRGRPDLRRQRDQQRQSIVSIADASDGDIRIAHGGRVPC